MKLFFDTNILLDILIARSDPQVMMESAKAISSAKQLNLELCVSAIAIPTIAYVIKNLPPRDKKTRSALLLKGFHVLSSTDGHVDYALKSKFRDIEDAMQYACAKENDCELFITRDIKDFKESDIPVLSPNQFLMEIS